MTGDELYEIVTTYADFGEHHTGTDADWATAHWLSDMLSTMGASSVERDEFTFDRYVVSAAELRSPQGRVIPSLPVFYSFIGALDTDDLERIAIGAEERLEAPATGLDPLLDSATSAALALTLGDSGADPVQCNRVPTARPNGPAAVIVAADNFGEIGEGASLSFDAALESGRAPNVVADFGLGDSHPLAPVTITTPLSGWTPAAGERGTGLAVALAMAAELASHRPVRFVACSGHELDHLGLRHYLSQTGDLDGRAAIHLGASVGAVEWSDDQPELGRERMVLTTIDDEALVADLRTSVARANWTLVERERWGGEGANWRARGAQVLSFLGTSSLFHTAGDVPAAATTPEAMTLACDVALQTAGMFLAGLD